MLLVLAMLKVDCKSTGGMRSGDERGNTGRRGRYGVEKGDSASAGPVAVAGAGLGGGGVAGGRECAQSHGPVCEAGAIC
jgi:hypothetical protein